MLKSLKGLMALSTLLLFMYGCRKDDRVQLPEKNTAHLQKEFFNLPQGTPAEVQKVADDLQKDKGFIKGLTQFVKKNGLPKWDKVIYKVSNNSSVLARSATTSEGQGLFLIPLQSQNSNEVKSYVTAYKHNDSDYSYRLYNRDSLNAVQPVTQGAAKQLLNAQAVFGYFEKSLNNKDSVNTNSPFNGSLKNVNIAFSDSAQSANVTNGRSASRLASCTMDITMTITFEWRDFTYDYGGGSGWYAVSVEINIRIDCTTSGNDASVTPDGTGTGGSGGSYWYQYGTGGPYYNPYNNYPPAEYNNWYPWWTSGGTGGVDPYGPLYTFENHELSVTQRDYWINPNNNSFVTSLTNYLSSNNYSIESKRHVQNLINLLISDPTLTLQELENYFLTPGEDGDGEYDASYWEDPSTVFATEPLPTFEDFYNAFPLGSRPPFGSLGTIGIFVTPMSSRDVYTLVGSNMDVQNKLGVEGYQNACAIRTSRGLNYSGRSIPAIRGTEVGDDGKNYILSAKGFNAYMNKKFGAPPSIPTQYKLTKAEINGDPKKISDFLKGKTGIYTMVISGKKFTGHADLILNGIVVGGTAINSDFDKVEKIEIWPLQ